MDQLNQPGLHVARGDAPPALAQEQCLRSIVGSHLAATLEPAFDRGDGFTADRQLARLVALAGDDQPALREIDVVEIDADQLGEAQPRRVNQFEHRDIAQQQRAGIAFDPQQAVDRVGVAGFRQRLVCLRRADLERRIFCHHPMLDQVLVKTANRR